MRKSSTHQFSRRACLTSGAVALATFLASPTILGQDAKINALLQSMSKLTGVMLQPQFVDSTADLVGVIVDISSSIRSLDLGEIEPATTFVAG